MSDNFWQKLLVAGGALIAGGAVLLWPRSASASRRRATEAVEGGGVFKAHLTGYWPYTAKDSEKKMEGGKKDRKEHPIYTLEMHLDDPDKYPWVSVSGDDSIFPYGQRIVIDEWPGVIFRVVDTGGRFRGGGKLYRTTGEEPLDIAVDSVHTKVSPHANVKIIKGDNFEGGKTVATAGFRDQTVVVGEGRIVPDFTNDSHALARAIESSAPLGTLEEKQAIAWAIRNRAWSKNESVASIVSPDGSFGPRGSGGRNFVASDKDPSDESMAVARAVLRLPADDDPTGGAVDFWKPRQQAALAVLGAAHWTAVLAGDGMSALKLARYRNSPSLDEARQTLADAGLVPSHAVGDYELLRERV